MFLPSRMNTVVKTATRRIDYKALFSYLSNMDFCSLINQSLSIYDLWDAFQLVIQSAVDNCSGACLLHNINVADRQRSLYLRKKRRWKQWRGNPTDKDMARYIQASKHLTETINRNQICADNALLSKNNHQFFSHVSKFWNATDHTITLKGSNDRAIFLI